MYNLDIILRTCDRTEVHPERGQRIINVDKITLIKKCYISLLNSIKLAKNLAVIKLTIVDDNSSDDTLVYLKTKAEQYDIDCEIVECVEEGFNFSALKQFELCKNKTGWVYCVEDDYLHFPNAIKQFIIMSEKLYNITGSYVAIRPDDDVFTYACNNHHSHTPCVVLLGEDRHWRTLYSSHNTIFTHSFVFKEYWELFASLGKFFKKLPINEDKSINMIWEKIPLFSPIPTLAVHISQNNHHPFVDYKTLWSNIIV
jgi:glycosyltransferase involved in cell wall biosynthesis